jgi:hypothetical protein
VALTLFTKLQVLTAAAEVHLEPNANALPGVPAAEKLINGLAKYTLIACLAAALLGIAQWALGSHSNNYNQSDAGKKKVIAAAGGAFLVGALAAIINFFVSAGGAVK